MRSLCAGTRSSAPFSVHETQAETNLELQVRLHSGIFIITTHFLWIYLSACLSRNIQHMEVLEELRQAQLLRKEQAREQAYLARLARELELQRAREQQQPLDEQQVDEQLHQGQAAAVANVSSPTTAATTAAVVPDAEGAAEGGRKRRRQVG